MLDEVMEDWFMHTAKQSKQETKSKTNTETSYLKSSFIT